MLDENGSEIDTKKKMGESNVTNVTVVVKDQEKLKVKKMRKKITWEDFFSEFLNVT